MGLSRKAPRSERFSESFYLLSFDFLLEIREGVSRTASEMRMRRNFFVHGRKHQENDIGV